MMIAGGRVCLAQEHLNLLVVDVLRPPVHDVVLGRGVAHAGDGLVVARGWLPGILKIGLAFRRLIRAEELTQVNISIFSGKLACGRCQCISFTVNSK